MSKTPFGIGLLLVGHGTRDDAGARQFLALADVLKKKFAPLRVEGTFLELAEPSIEAGVERLLACGVEKIVTMPLILFAAGHVKRDIPEQVAAALAARARPEVTQVQLGHLGCHPAMVELSRLRMEEAERRGGPQCSGPSEDPHNEKRERWANEEVQAEDASIRGQRTECLVLVARGSSDEQAAAEMREFAALRQAEQPGIQVEMAFLAKARPTLDEQFARLAAAQDTPAAAPMAAGNAFTPRSAAKITSRTVKSRPRVVVQPHFLFAGELVERIRGQTAAIAAAQPQKAWIMAEPLAGGPGVPGLASELLAKVILDRCRERGIRVVASPDDD